jgi:hypothetical protein
MVTPIVLSDELVTHSAHGQNVMGVFRDPLRYAGFATFCKPLQRLTDHS